MLKNTLKIIIIDHELSWHQNYHDYFEAYTDYELQGTFVSIKDALSVYQTLRPDIIFSEVSMPDLCGIEGIKYFRKKDPNVTIIMLTAENDFDVIKRAFKSTANGFLSKPVSKRSLYNALDSIKSEGTILSNDIAKKVISMFQRKSRDFFSERENQVIDFLCEGATYQSIADKLFVTASAVNFHIQNIYLKLDVNSKSEALIKLEELEYE